MRTASLLLSIIQTMIMKRLILARLLKTPVTVGVIPDCVTRVNRIPKNGYLQHPSTVKIKVR